MHERAFHRLLREGLALLAILAMVLGPLALATSRSLAAQERVNVAAGLSPLLICAPGDSIDGLAAKTGGAICDHCLPATGPTPAPQVGPAIASSFAPARFPADTCPSAVLAHLRLPPSTGPPST